MGEYAFKADLKNSEPGVKWVAEVLPTLPQMKGVTEVEVRENWFPYYDIEFRFDNEPSEFVEVKEDIEHKNTGNVVIEIESRGKKSGISVTTAETWISLPHMKDGTIQMWAFKTEDLRDLIKKCEYERFTIGGDPGSNTKMYLFKLNKLKKHGIRIR